MVFFAAFFATDFAAGIDFVLNKADAKTLSANARKKVIDNFSQEIVANKYINVYRSILK